MQKIHRFPFSPISKRKGVWGVGCRLWGLFRNQLRLEARLQWSNSFGCLTHMRSILAVPVMFKDCVDALSGETSPTHVPYFALIMYAVLKFASVSHRDLRSILWIPVQNGISFFAPRRVEKEIEIEIHFGQEEGVLITERYQRILVLFFLPKRPFPPPSSPFFLSSLSPHPKPPFVIFFFKILNLVVIQHLICRWDRAHVAVSH